MLPWRVETLWHAFDASATTDTQLCAQQYGTDDFDAAWYSRMKLWPGLGGSPDHTQHDQGIVGWRWAVNEVHKHQHPPRETCKSSQKFLIGHEFPFGFGAEMHVWGGMLNAALSLGRVMVQSPDSATPSFVNNPFCSASSTPSNMECYYEPWSSCTLEDALGADGVDLYRATYDKHLNIHKRDYASKLDALLANHSGPSFFTLQIEENGLLWMRLRDGDAAALEELRLTLEPYRTVVLWNVANALRTTIPTPLQAFSEHCLPMLPQFKYYWWRAVSATFLIRPNERTLLWLEEQRALYFPGRFGTPSAELSAANTTAASATQPTQPTQQPTQHRMQEQQQQQRLRPQATLAMYIRHGDKGFEMKLVHPDAYLQTAVSLFDRGLVKGTLSQPQQQLLAPAERVIFYGTETPDVLQYVEDWAPKHPEYTVLRTHLVDVVDDVHHTQPWEYPSMLLNLDLSLRADAWVMTLGSNWCRVIDELRATVAGKQDLPFADLSVKTCPHPPCIGSGITDFDWRH